MNLARKQNVNKLLITAALLLVLFSLFTLGALKEQEGVRLSYNLDSGVRRDTLHESGSQLTFNLRAGTQPQVLNENLVTLDLTQTVLPPIITDTNSLYNWSSLQTEVVWTALSLVLNNSNGTVDFSTTIDLSNVPVLDLDKYVNISSNYIEINGSAIPQFNTTAQLTLTNLIFSDIRVLKDGTNCTECSIISYNNNNLIFNAPGFTVYQAVDKGIFPAIKISTRVNVTNATMNVSGDAYNGSYPTNITIDIGNDGTVEWNTSDELNSTEQQVTDISDALNSLIKTCGCNGCDLSANGLTCTVSIGISSATPGTVILSDLNVSQVIRNATWNRGTTYTLIDLDDYFYDQNSDNLVYTSKGNSNIGVAISDGVVSLSAGNWYGQENVTFYANDSTNITKSNNVSLTVVYVAVCGDGTCESALGETCSNCETDCGTCGIPTTCADLNCPTYEYDACTTGGCRTVDGSPECYSEAVTCDDNNECTDDSCNSATGCVYTPNTVACDDENACTENDVCSGGSCSGTAIVCDPITGDVCWDGTTAECTPTCSAGICGTCAPVCPECVENWVCGDWGDCIGGTQTRSCSELSGCGEPCAGRPECIEAQSCVACSTAADCDDADLCTTDSCVGGACSNVATICEDSVLYCMQTNEWVSCANTCDSASGLCGDCSGTLECPVDVCYGYECPDLDITCPDGSTVTCTRVCEDIGYAQCSECDENVLCIDTCEGVTCRDYCSGDVLYSGGSCIAGTCEYSSEVCEFGCSKGQCKDEPVIEPELEIEEAFKPEADINLVPCINITKWLSGKALEMKVVDISDLYDLPEGYDIVIEPFNLNCEGDSLDLTFSIPDNYIDVHAIKCSGSGCAPTTVTKVTELVCGKDVIKEWRKEEVFDPELAFIDVKEINVTLSGIQQTLQSGKTKVKFIGEALEGITATLSAGKEPQPKNPSMRIIGAPLTLKLDKVVKTGTTVTMPYVSIGEFDEDSIAIYARINDDWEYIGGRVNKNTKTVIANIRDISKYIDENNEVHLALIAVICVNCLESNLEKVYEPTKGSRDSIILVHGLGSSPETYREIIDDIRLTNQPFQTWTFGYPYDRAIEENAKEFAEQLELHSSEYDRIYIIAHSLGGILAQKALYDSFNENSEAIKYSYLEKVKKVVLVGVPNEGSPGAELYRNLFKDLINKKTTKTLFNPNSPAIDELVKGSITPRVPGIDYYVIAGTKAYEFDLVFFKVTSDELFEEGVENDGLVSIFSAQNIGGEYINDMCKDYWELDVTHTDLIGHPLARQLIEKIIAEEILKIKEGQAILGSSKYFNLAIDQCSPEDKYLLIGKKINKAELYDVCSCGNGVCGIGENAVNCPSDCAVFFSRERVYYFLVYLLLIPLLLVIGTFAYREYRRLKLPLAARKELSEFNKLDRLASKYIKANLIGKAVDAYNRLKIIYIDLVKFELGKKQEKKLYSKVKDVYTIIRTYEEFSAVKDKKLMQFDLLYLEAQSYIEDKLLLKALKSYNELKAVYIELAGMRIGLIQEYKLYKKVREIYSGLIGLRKEEIEGRLEGFNESFKSIKRYIKEGRISNAARNYKRLRTAYIDLIRLDIGSFREYGLYRNVKGVYRLIKKVKEPRKLIKELDKEKKLEQFNILLVKLKEQIDLNDLAAFASYKQLRATYIELVDKFGADYVLYYKVRRTYRLLKRLKKEEVKERIRRFKESIIELKELIKNRELERGVKEYNKLKNDYINLVKLNIGIVESRLYLDIKEAHNLLNKTKKECIKEIKLDEFDRLSSEFKDLISTNSLTKAVDLYRKLKVVYIELVGIGVGFKKYSLYKRAKETYKLIEKLRDNLIDKRFGRLANKTKELIRKGEIKAAFDNYKKLNSMYIELANKKISFIKKHRVYKDVKKVYRLLKNHSKLRGK